MNNPLRIGSRRSLLAITQSRQVGDEIQRRTGTRCEIVEIDTTGDRASDDALPDIGVKGLFTRELEDQLIDGSIDIAVHSLKDLPGELPAGLVLGAVGKREDPRDVLVTRSGNSLRALAESARIGTGSLRRAAQVRALRADIEIAPIRGNVPTRLRKLDEGHYDAIILAAAGLTRLGLAKRITEYFDIEQMIPAAGQGALGIECRGDDDAVLELLASIDDPADSICCRAERRVQARLDVGCNAPAGVHAMLRGDSITVHAFVSDTSGARILKTSERASRADADAVADAVATRLIEDGANELLAFIRKSDE
ncbi:MAG: hydroxymethylbilane synthase [Candidatus Krumholzibacteriota bacterium]|nr:hydroxymethylbilane synthase [Candidatus Krumholzibacteriota bacterium]